MGFFDTEKGVEQYIKMAEGYDGAELIKILQKIFTWKLNRVGAWYRSWKGHGHPKDFI